MPLRAVGEFRRPAGPCVLCLLKGLGGIAAVEFFHGVRHR